MTDTKTNVEKREHKRFKAQKDTYAALVNGSTRVGQILNICKDGLAFSYIGQEAPITGWHKMNMFMSGNRFYLKEVPFKAISDFHIDAEVPFSTVLMKQCGGQFGELTDGQICQLKYFIENHTTIISV